MLCGALLCLGACDLGADVTIVGELQGRELRADGTLVAWVDRTVYVEDESGVRLVRRPVGDTRLHLRFFERVFDPQLALDRLTAGERAALETDLAKGDRLDIVIERGAAVRIGDVVEAASVGNEPEVLPYIGSLSVHLAEDLRAAQDYPASALVARVPRGQGTLDVKTVSPLLSGMLSFDVETANEESETFTVGFRVELLPERVGECNFDSEGAGVVDPCTLNLLPGTP